MWDAIKGVFKAVGEYIKDNILGPIGCIGAGFGYAYARAAMAIASRNVSARVLSPSERQLLADVFQVAGRKVNLDPVRILEPVALAAISGNPSGLTLGNNVYLARKIGCNRKDLALLAHEVTHVSQYQFFGTAVFVCMYGALIAETFDSRNALEVEAYRVQHLVTDAMAGKYCAASPAAAETRTGSDWFWLVWGA